MSVIQGFLHGLSHLRVPVWHQGSVGTEGTRGGGCTLLPQKYKLELFVTEKSVPQISIWKWNQYGKN